LIAARQKKKCCDRYRAEGRNLSALVRQLIMCLDRPSLVEHICRLAISTKSRSPSGPAQELRTPIAEQSFALPRLTTDILCGPAPYFCLLLVSLFSSAAAHKTENKYSWN
jgi:hypothetical protein